MVGLLGGIGPWHVRVLCDNPWEGGRGYTPKEVGDMTLDQVLMLFADRKILLNRKRRKDPLTVKPDKDGMIPGRDRDGKPIRGRVGGKSVARRLMEASERKK